MSIRLGAHWLAFLWNLVVGDGDNLRAVVAQAKAAGATVFELMPPLLNGMTAKETAQALKDGGITHAVMCHFYPEGALGDPLGLNDELQKAVTAFDAVITYMEELRAEGITIDLIVGPSCFVLAKEYGLPEDELRRRIGTFYAKFTSRLRLNRMKVAVELLRDVEDKVFATEENTEKTLATLPIDVFGLHLDTFHFRDREYDIVAAIKRFAGRIFHFHANGKDRVPPGHDHDDIKWDGPDGVVAALKAVGYDGTATNEPFCEVVRAAAPELGEGLPPAMPEPQGLQMTADNLTAAGMFA